MPILGLGIGYVGSPFLMGFARLMGGMLCVGCVGNGLCLSGLACGFIPLFTPCISGTLMPLDFAWDLVCIRYLFVFVSLIPVMLLTQ